MAGGLGVATGGGSNEINKLYHDEAWYKNTRLIKLNLWILLLLITSSTNGYDGMCPKNCSSGGAVAVDPTRPLGIGDLDSLTDHSPVEQVP